jgi:hypothetical protein
MEINGVRILDYETFDPQSPFDFKERLKIGEATEKLRSIVPPISKFLQYIDEKTVTYVDEVSEEANTEPYPFTTKGTGKSVEQFLKKNGYNWMAIEDFTPEIMTLRNLNDGSEHFVRKEYEKLWVKRRMNHYHKDMMVKGLRTYMATSMSSAFQTSGPNKGKLSPYQNLPKNLLKYDVAGSESISQDKFTHYDDRITSRINYGVDRGNSQSFLKAIESPMFFILGPNNLNKVGEGGIAIQKTDENGTFIGYEQREIVDEDWLLLVIPYTKKKPFVINQQVVRTSGRSKDYESYFAISMSDEFTNGGRGYAMNPFPNITYQKYIIRDYLHGYPMSSNANDETDEDGNEWHITDAQKANEFVNRNFNYNYLQDMGGSFSRQHPLPNEKKKQFDLSTKRGQMYKSSTIKNLKDFGGYTPYTIYGVLMKTDELEETYYRLRQMGYGIINQTGF